MPRHQQRLTQINPSGCSVRHHHRPCGTALDGHGVIPGFDWGGSKQTARGGVCIASEHTPSTSRAHGLPWQLRSRCGATCWLVPCGLGSATYASRVAYSRAGRGSVVSAPMDPRRLGYVVHWLPCLFCCASRSLPLATWPVVRQAQGRHKAAGLPGALPTSASAAQQPLSPCSRRSTTLTAPATQ